jgi:hypothetical protein
MKKSIYFVAAMLLLVSCYPTDSYLHFVVKITDNIKAVISINTSPHRRCWSGNEEITILSETKEGCTGLYEDIYAEASYVLYPADVDATLAENRIYTTLPQYRDCCSIAEPIMVAKGDNGAIAFEEVSGLLCFNLTNTIGEELLLKSVTLSSASQAISGMVAIDCNDLSMHIVDHKARTIMLPNVDVALSAEPEVFYIVMPPLAFTEGELSVTFEFEGGAHTAILPALTLQRGVVHTVNCEF